MRCGIFYQKRAAERQHKAHKRVLEHRKISVEEQVGREVALERSGKQNPERVAERGEQRIDAKSRRKC